MKFDAIVVGAGTGGSITAKTLTSMGLKVCLIDLKDKKTIGNKVCGDAIGKHHFDNLGIPCPKGEELEQVINGIKVFSPDLQTVFRLSEEKLPGFMINRYLFGQRLLNDAVDAGAILFDSTYVSEPIIKDGYVKGVLAKDIKTGSKLEIKSEVTIDASGVSAVVRSKLPPEIRIDTVVKKEDQIVCYREIRELKKVMDEPDFCQIYLDLESAPGGYYWIFSEGGNRVNVGLGVVESEGHPNPKNQLYERVLSGPLFKSSDLIHGGGGIVPTRRPLDSLVGNGIVVIGDSACCVNPIHGGGMGPSMTAGKIAGEVITKALEASEPTLERLWPINVQYMRSYGAKQAGLDVFRLFLQGLTNDDLNYGMRYRLIKEDDVIVAGLDGDVNLDITDATRRVFIGLGRFMFLRKLYYMAKLSKKAKALYRHYPNSPEDISDWKVEVQEVFKRIYRVF